MPRNVLTENNDAKAKYLPIERGAYGLNAIRRGAIKQPNNSMVHCQLERDLLRRFIKSSRGHTYNRLSENWFIKTTHSILFEFRWYNGNQTVSFIRGKSKEEKKKKKKNRCAIWNGKKWSWIGKRMRREEKRHPTMEHLCETSSLLSSMKNSYRRGDVH